MAAALFDAPIALISLVDEQRQWLKACVGLERRETPRAHSFCSHAIADPGAMVVPDALTDPRFADNPQVTGEPGIRFYAGQPIHAPSGEPLGTLCVVDRAPRTLDDRELGLLADLALWAEAELGRLWDDDVLGEIAEAVKLQHASESRTAAVMSSVADAIVTFGDDGFVESANEAAASTFGYSLEEFGGVNVAELIDGVEWEALERMLGITGDEPTIHGKRRELLGCRRDGSLVPLELVVNETLVGGRPLFVAAGRDITERREAVAAIERARREFESLLTGAGEGIVGVDADARIRFVNPAAVALLGRGADELVGEHVEDAIPRRMSGGELVDWRDSIVRRSLEEGLTHRVSDRELIRADGHTFPADLTVTPIRDDAGISGAVMVVRDVTERYEIARMKDEFVSVVGHELRTPLTAIRGSLGLMVGGVAGELPERAGSMLEIALRNTERLIRLINDILDLERIEAGRIDMQVAPVDATTLLRDAADAVRQLAADAEVSLVTSDDGASLEADRDRIVQALVNLAGNAVKFSPPGATVDLTAARAGANVRFEVRDRGRGIPADKLPRLFERFEQVDPSDAREKGGTGLGLAISKSIVEQHGGRIWVESEPGAGSTFGFEIPVAR